ncbi:hypothetical protein GCM10010472_33400 [Pseudonocardia halophobica]|uniref:Uncharacterized protein n=1 Tax=Pseudonocardia halophobica TaxID=29401 RepID=A0A9W6L2I5_9PSEU|nr:hypothetical protein [Pseudonocardia halophobica]GLL12527.1 hypothetical protein GCM10017577_36680 [Pseudonocardia halophobica]
MPRHRYRPPRSALTRLAGAATLAGAAVVGLTGPAQAATPDLVPDLAPLLTAHDDPADGAEPAPAPEAPYVEPSSTAFDQGDLLNQGRDLAPAGVPIAGLTQSAVGAPSRLLPS